MPEVTRKIVDLGDGKYVHTWDYSQGIFGFTKTDDPLRAASITATQFKTFFKERGRRLRTCKIKYEIE
jgi:hypothetical protein